jgi:hypothetical protein
MSRRLEQAMDAARRLPEDQQDRLADWLLEMLAADQKWDDLFARSQDQLEKLAGDALRDHAEGRTVPLDPDKL